MPHAGAGALSVAAAWRAATGGRCAVCRGWCDGGLCAWCDARFASVVTRCDGCALPTEGLESRCFRCQRSPPPWSHAVTGVDYAYPWDRLLADFKFHGRLDQVGVLLRPLTARLGETQVDAVSAIRVVPIPLSRQRLRERGYNQSWELARRLARTFDLEARSDALFRVRDTGHQLGLQRAARQANIAGAFVVTPRHARWVRGATIALVDDVLTTGATAGSATRTLLAAGARAVHLWVVARTPDD